MGTKLKCWKGNERRGQWQKIDSEVKRINLAVFQDKGWRTVFFGYDPQGSNSFSKKFESRKESIKFAKSYMKKHDKC